MSTNTSPGRFAWFVVALLVPGLALGFAGASSGKNFITSSSTFNFPSALASPTAVEVKLLLNENIKCGSSAAYGAHQPSAITSPSRRATTCSSIRSEIGSSLRIARAIADSSSSPVKGAAIDWFTFSSSRPMISCWICVVPSYRRSRRTSR